MEILGIRSTTGTWHGPGNAFAIIGKHTVMRGKIHPFISI